MQLSLFDISEVKGEKPCQAVSVLSAGPEGIEHHGVWVEQKQPEPELEPVFKPDDIVYAYTRKMALDDGFQIDATKEPFAEVTKQHFRYPVYMTSGVYDIIEAAVNNKRHGNDWLGVWHDILTMCKHGHRIDEATRYFKVKITGAGRQSLYEMYAQAGPMDPDDPTPVVTIMLPEDM